MLVVVVEEAGPVSLISRQDVVLPVDHHADASVCKCSGTTTRSYHIPCSLHVHPAYFLMAWSGITVLQGCGTQAGNDCDIGNVMGVVGAVLPEQGDSTISLKKRILSVAFITKY